MPLRPELESAVVAIDDRPPGQKVGNLLDVGFVVSAVDTHRVELEHLSGVILNRESTAIGTRKRLIKIKEHRWRLR